MSVQCWEFAGFFEVEACFLPVSSFPMVLIERIVISIGPVVSSFGFAVVLRQERVFDKCVQFGQVDVGQDWTHNSSLWASAQGWVPSPLFQVSGVERSLDEVKEASVMDLFGKDGEEDGVID